MADFTPTQGRYLAFIHAYTNLHGYPPAESEIAAAMCVSPPSVNQMVKMLEKKGLILRQPGQPRSLQVLVPEDEIPPWNSRKQATESGASGQPAEPRGSGPGSASGELVRRFGLLDGWAHQQEVRQQGNQPRDRNPRRPDARTSASRHLQGVRPLGRTSVRVSVRQTSVRSRRTQLRSSRVRGQGRKGMETHARQSWTTWI